MGRTDIPKGIKLTPEQREEYLGYKPKNIPEILENVEMGDIIRVKWLDACKVTNVDEDRISENKVFATYKQHTGAFFAVKLDKLYKQRFLILRCVQTNGLSTIVSIPIVCIMKIDKYPVTDPTVKHTSEAGSPFLATKHLPIIEEEHPIGDGVTDGE